MILEKLRQLGKGSPKAGEDDASVQRERTRTRAPAPHRDQVTHPWRELVLREKKIIRAAPGKEGTEYLATPEVKIVGKEQVVVNTGGGRASYGFKLNTAPDIFWRHRFAKNLEHLPKGINRSDIRVEIADDSLLLLCMPSKLEDKYACVKANVARTNADYQNEKQAVRDRISHLGNERKKQAGRTKVDLVKERFERLEL